MRALCPWLPLCMDLCLMTQLHEVSYPTLYRLICSVFQDVTSMLMGVARMGKWILELGGWLSWLLISQAYKHAWVSQVVLLFAKLVIYFSRR